MNIYANEGFKVRVATLKGGYPIHQELAEEHLEVGKEYTIDSTSVSGFHTDVRLEEIPNVNFNSVFFEDVEGQSNDDESHPDWMLFNRYLKTV